MTITIHFTKSAIAGLKPQFKHYQVNDASTPGLILRVHAGGVKTFMFFRRVDGKLKRIKIGRFGQVTIEAARKAAIQWNSKAIDGLLNINKKELTFCELYDKYYKQYALLHTKRPADNKATLNFHIMHKIGHLRVSKVTRELLKEHHLEQGLLRGKQQANRVLTMISAAYNFGIREELIVCPNPCMGIKRFKSKSRDRFLATEELKLFFKELKAEDQLYQDFFMLCILIGARKTSMLAMRYDQIDFGLRRFRLSEDESKNDDVNIYVLPDAAIEILKRRFNENSSAKLPSVYVFPGEGIKGHLCDPKRAFARIKERMGVKDLWIHDLRRTLGSHMAINNSSLQIIGQALNHKSHVSTQIYARLSYEPVLEAVNKAANNMLYPTLSLCNIPTTNYAITPTVRFKPSKSTLTSGYSFPV